MVAAQTVTRQRVVLVLLVGCVVLAGCSGTETTSTATPTDSGAGTNSAAGGAIHELTIANRTSTTAGGATALTLAVRANTTLGMGDLTSNPEPYFAVELNGQPAMQTTQVDRQDNGTFTIALNASVISSVPAGQTNVTVVLMEADSLSNDRVDAASIAVRTTPSETPEPTPAQPTTTAGPADPSTSTRQPTTRTTGSTQTATPPPTPNPRPSPTATPAPDVPIDGGTARQATVTRVIDGDTVEVTFENGETDTLRLIGVDTPEPIMSNEDPSEYGIPDSTAGQDWLLNWADKASAFATEELAGQQVRVVTDPNGDTRGSYGRLLAYIYYNDGTNFNRELIERGLARRYDDSTFTLREEFGTVKANAQADNRGLWAFERDDSTPAPTPAPTPEPTTTETASNGDLPPQSNDGDLPDPYDCGDFDGYPDEALRTYMQNNPDDPSELDADGNGVACGVGYS
jgi:micrococcal nuclease